MARPKSERILFPCSAGERCTKVDVDGNPGMVPRRPSRVAVNATGRYFCNANCRNAVGARPPAAEVVLICQYEPCGEPYKVARRKAETSRYCCDEHRDLAARRPDWGNCPVCGLPVPAHRKYCSTAHYREATKGKSRQTRSDKNSRKVEWFYGSCSGPDCCNLLERRRARNSPDGPFYCSKGCYRRDAGRFGKRGGAPSVPVGTRRVTSEGYIDVRVEKGKGRGRGRWKAEHVLLMEQLLGRAVLPGETVHHVNTVRDDNSTDGPLVNWRSGNLELWSHGQPKGARVVDLVEWAKTLLRRYEPNALDPDA